MVSSIKSVAYKTARISEHNPVVKGNFPAYEDLKELLIFKFNRFLSFLLILNIIISMVSYSMVVAKENTINEIHRKTKEISFENLELQSKVDYARSYNNINTKIAKVNYLKKPDKVLEVNASATIPVIQKNSDNVKVKPIPGY